MLDNKGFDLWADEYDKTVSVSDEGNTYPFAGYKDVLGNIFKNVWPTRIRIFDFGHRIVNGHRGAVKYRVQLIV